MCQPVWCIMQNVYVLRLSIGWIYISRLLIGPKCNVNCRIMSKIDCDKTNLSKTSYAAVILMIRFLYWWEHIQIKILIKICNCQALGPGQGLV